MSSYAIRGALLRTSAVAALFALGATGASASTVVGGGSTLGGPEYQLIFAAAGLQTPPSYTCTTSVDICYAFVGSGGGTTGFLNNDSTQFSLAAGIPVDFGGSDSILSVPQITGFKTTYGYQLIQVPAFGTPVAAAFNYAGKASNAAIKLNDNDLCGIFSGLINDWSKVTTTTGLSGPIAVAYREDSSGTSFLLTNHLGAVCTTGNATASFVSALNTNKTTGSLAGKAGYFGGTTRFATLFPGYTTGTNATTPSVTYNFVPTGTFNRAVPIEALTGVNGPNGQPLVLGAGTGRPGNGSGGVQQQVVGNAKAIGYIGPDYTAIAANPTLASGVAKAPYVATVNKALPNINNTTFALNSFKFKPVATNPDTLGVLVPVPNAVAGKTPYPIVGYTNLFFSSKYSSAAKVTIVKNFLDCLYNVSGTTCTSTVANLTSKGFVQVPGVTNATAPKAGTLAGQIVKAYLANNATVKITSGAGGR